MGNLDTRSDLGQKPAYPADGGDDDPVEAVATPAVYDLYVR